MKKRHGNGDNREDEARRVMERVRNESETVGTSSLARIAMRAQNHMSGADADPDDPIEIWGRRIGRALSLVVFVALAIWLLSYLRT